MLDYVSALWDYEICLTVVFVIVVELTFYKLLKFLYGDPKRTIPKIRDNNRRRVGKIPPVYPNGWFGLLETSKVGKSECVYVVAFGQELAVFRDAEGAVYVLDTECPHTTDCDDEVVSFQISGGCKQCPFRGWKLQQDGKCATCPNVQELARMKTWTSVEVNGWIIVWHHAERARPSWKVPEIPEISTGVWTLKGENTNIINTHIEDISENSADFIHFKQVHEPFSWNGVTDLMNWIKNEFFFDSWTGLKQPNGHISEINFTFDISFFGFLIPRLFRLTATAFQIGPGISHFYFDGLFFKFVVVHAITPVRPMIQRYTRRIYMHWALPRLIGFLYMLFDEEQIKRDILIWTSKTYLAKPVYSATKEDTIIARHRRWYSQFYSEHSLRYNQIEDTVH